MLVRKIPLSGRPVRRCLLPHHPVLVVTSRLTDEYLWKEVLNLGAHDVLAKLFRAAQVQWVLESARRIWASRKKGPLNAWEAAMGSGANVNVLAWHGILSQVHRS